MPMKQFHRMLVLMRTTRRAPLASSLHSHTHASLRSIYEHQHVATTSISKIRAHIACQRWCSSSRGSSSSNSHRSLPGVHATNPFQVLGVPATSSYAAVKRRFIELALKHHPDAQRGNAADTKSSSPSNADTFIELRQAFEVIQETQDGGSRVMQPGDDAHSMSDDEFQAWFYEETGHADVLFRMNLTTRKEMAQVAAEQSQGGLDKGGMWELARQMQREQEHLQQHKGSILRKHGKYEGGDGKSNSSNSLNVGVGDGANGSGDDGHRRRRRRRR